MLKTLNYHERRSQRKQKRLRERAQEIVKATRRYSAPFRAEVQDALINWPHKLPMLILEAERMAERRGIRPKQGKPLARSSRAFSHESDAERAESLCQQEYSEALDPRMVERAKLLRQMLCDVSSEAEIDVSDRHVIRAYMMAIEHHGNRHAPFVAAALHHAKQILNGCDDHAWQHIQDFWSSDPAKNRPAREQDHCFSWHCKHFGGGIKLSRERAETTAAPISLRELKASAEKLRGQLRFLDEMPLPENESTRFQVQTELYEVEREIEAAEAAQAAEHWPDIIGEREE